MVGNELVSLRVLGHLGGEGLELVVGELAKARVPPVEAALEGGVGPLGGDDGELFVDGRG